MKQRTNKPGSDTSGTSGQSVPKSPRTKFRQKSQQEQAAAAKLRMEAQSEKVDRARETLSKQKPLKKPGSVKRIGRIASGSVHGFVHGKIYEVEHENVGTEGAHRSELLGEAALRHSSRFVKRKVREHPTKAVQKAEARYAKYTADYHFHTVAQEHPELTKNALTRYWQKQRLRRQYRKRAKEAAKQGAVAAEKTAVTTEKLAARTVAFVKRHPAGCLLAVFCILIMFAVQSCSSTLVMLGNAGAGALGASTYPCEDRDLLGAEAAYCALEDELREYLDTYESAHDYDEYHFDLDDIEHDPYVLLSLLCALHEEQWTVDEVQSTLQKKRHRPIHLHVMVSEEEQALIYERMAEAGIRNMGAYMRKWLYAAMCSMLTFHPSGSWYHSSGDAQTILIKWRSRPTLTARFIPRKSPPYSGTMPPCGGRCPNF